jgi:hypothetical protein
MQDVLQMTTFHTINFGKTKSLGKVKVETLIIQQTRDKKSFKNEITKLRTPQSICLPILLQLIVCLAIKAPGLKPIG